VIEPDDATKKQIQRDGKARVIGSYKLCISDAGTVAAISPLKGTGYPAYDQKIVREMHGWAYQPFQVNGKATPVCTAVTFLYSP